MPDARPRMSAWQQAALSLYWFATNAHWTAILITLLPLQAEQIGGAEFKGTTLRINLTGAGNIAPVGQVDNLELVVSGAGNFAGENLVCKNATVYVRGVGNATVNATDTLDAHVSGVGSILYIGDPKVTKEMTGVGTINKR